ncbi:uncharacterized protein LOC129714293 [Leucoraja erinacea]|uniref:uncharacterized protein LOC129714293 n=1 Tax=Leucoraja erinaceus TaxID=7782 RepID=UPI002458C59F|nr:uncharacterized protein LOC129714293 [Leucoraja erinacea]
MTDQQEIGIEDFWCIYKVTISGREIISEPSDYVKITVVDTLQTPTASFDQASGVYIEGEPITIICTVNSDYDHSVKFYRENELLATTQVVTRGSTAMIALASRHQQGQYHCQYQAVVGKRRLLSRQSQNVNLTVIDPLPRPRISLTETTGVYTGGETVSIACNVNRMYPDDVYFYRNNALLTSRQISTVRNTGTFLVNHSSQGGWYKCKYGIHTKKRRLESKFSKAVSVTIADQLLQPEISINQPTAVYLRGDTLKLTCTTARKYRGKVYFFRDNQIIASRHLFAKYHMKTFTSIGLTEAGSYQCKYGTRIKERWLESRLSEAVNVTIVGK